MIEVYTDGSCLGNPGVGGWAFLVIKENKLTSKSGLDKNTTNNRMELLALRMEKHSMLQILKTKKYGNTRLNRMEI